MEKFFKVIKTILLIILIIILISFCLSIVASIKSSRDWLKNLFGNYSQIDVDSFDGADINWNGGLTKKEIAEQKADANCPTCDDLTDTIYIQEYEDIVCFYKKIQNEDNETIYPNIVFVKTEQGLKFDGALNMKGTAKYYPLWYECLIPGYPYYCGPKEYIVEQNLSEVPNYWYNDLPGWFFQDTNLCLFDSSDTSFYLVDSGLWYAPDCGIDFYLARTETALKIAQKYVIENIYNNYFLKFCDNKIEIIQEKDNKEVASGDFNFFYDYLYRSAKSYDYGKDSDGNSLTFGTCSVDVSDLTVYPLPTELQGKFEIGNTGKYYGIYNCNVFMTCHYEKKEVKTVYADSPSLIDGVDDDLIETKDIEVNPMATVQISLKAKGEYLNGIIRDVVKENPVSINYYCDNKLVRSVVFDSSKFIDGHAKNIVALPHNFYTFEIVSNQLIFDFYSGNVNIESTGQFEYVYTYLNGMVLSSYEISPASSDIDLRTFDFATYPVKIVLANKETSKTYQFVFDDVSKINVAQTQLIQIGNYTYTILSEKLVFGSTSGSVEISPKNRIFKYQFAIDNNQSDLSFTVKVSTASSSSNGAFRLSGDTASVNLLSNKLNLINYFVNIFIFDADGNVVETFKHTHNGNGSCGDNWSTSNLIAGTKYIAQMQYSNGSDSTAVGYISYESATFSFTYNNNTAYTLTYSCVENV